MLKRLLRNTALSLVVSLTLSGLLAPALSVSATESIEDRIARQRGLAIESNAWDGWPAGPVVNAESAILMDADNGTILYSKNIHAKEYPASMTKILTSLIAYETCALDEPVTISQAAVSDTPRGSSHVALDVGEVLPMEDALKAILIASANEASFAVAEHIAGSWQAFGDIMNEKAASLGCTESHFVNPNGLPNDNHYTSAYDLALIASSFFSHDYLCQLSSTGTLDIEASPTQPDHITEYCKNQLLPGRKYAYEYLLGSKTGYTDAARNCLVSGAEKNGMRLVCVVFKDESPMQFQDTVTLFDYGFSNFQKVNVSESETKYQINTASFYSDTHIFGSKDSLLSLNQTDALTLPLGVDFQDTQSEVSYDTLSDNQAAVIYYTYRGNYVGSATIDLADNSGSTSIFDSQKGEESSEEISASAGEEADKPAVTETASDAKASASSGPAVVFINIVKILAWIGGILLAIALCFFGFFGIRRVLAGKRAKRRRRRRYTRTALKRPRSSADMLREKHYREIQRAKRRQKSRSDVSLQDFDF